MFRISLLIVLVFLVKILWTREIAYFIHPRHFWLIYLSIFLIVCLLVFGRGKTNRAPKKHILLFLTLGILIVASIVQFAPLTSFAQKNKTNILPQLPASEYARNKRSTYFSFDTRQRSLVDWVTLQSFNPEPLAYENQEAHITGFYYIDDNNQPMIAQYVVNCCAADARIIGMFLSAPLEVEINTWLDVEGTLHTAISDRGRYLALEVSKHTSISPPDNPYVTR